MHSRDALLDILVNHMRVEPHTHTQIPLHDIVIHKICGTGIAAPTKSK